MRRRTRCAVRPRVALLGVIWMAIPLSLFPFAEQHVSSSVTGMLNGATPIFVTAVAAFMAHRLPRRQAIVGLAIGFLGVVLIALPSGGGDNSWFGMGLIVLALVFYGFALNVAVPLQQKYGSIPLMWRVQGVAFVLVVPFAVPSLDDVHFTWSAFLAMVALGSLGTALAYVTMAANAGRLGSSRASASVYLIPVVSLLLGAFVRHETVAALSVLGCSVALMVRTSPPPPSSASETRRGVPSAPVGRSAPSWILSTHRSGAWAGCRPRPRSRPRPREIPGGDVENAPPAPSRGTRGHRPPTRGDHDGEVPLAQALPGSPGSGQRRRDGPVDARGGRSAHHVHARVRGAPRSLE